MDNGYQNYLGGIIKQRRLMADLTLHKLSIVSGVSASHLGRIERGERFPSARILQKISKPLNFKEAELFELAGFLLHQTHRVTEDNTDQDSGRLDPIVSIVLSQEPAEVQRTVLGVLSVLRNLANCMKSNGDNYLY